MSEVGELGLPLPKNTASLPRFCNLVRLFTSLVSIQGKGSVDVYRNTVMGFIKAWKKSIGDDIYPAIRLWFPQEDIKLKQLSRIKDNVLGKLIADALDLPPKSASALALSQVRRGSHRSGVDSEDNLAFRTKRAVDERFPIRPFSQLRIDEVISMLEKFSNADKEAKLKMVKRFINELNSDELFWLIKIIQNNLAIRSSEKSFLRAFHPNAEQVYKVNKSLKLVCEQLWSDSFEVTEKNKSIQPMCFFCPMLAKYVKGLSEDFGAYIDIINHDKESQFYIEEKVDGERVQLHWLREGNVTKFLSRRSLDHTDSYSGIFSGYKGLPDVKMSDIVDESVESVILDGEIVAWDPETGDLCGQSKVRELTNYVKKGSYKHMMYVFDILYLNGSVFTDVPLRIRKQKLLETLPKSKSDMQQGRIQSIPFKIGKSADDIALEFKKIISEMSEGLVLKNPESSYHLDARTNDWIKVKPEYVNGYAGETLDMVIVGAYWGSGRLQSKFGSYLVALRDETQNKKFVALTKVGSGICMAIHLHIYDTVNEVMYSSRDPPNWLDMGVKSNSKPDVYFPFDKSLIMEVKYSEIIPDYSENGDLNGYWLRFPRYVKLRTDKSWENSATVGEFLEIQSSKRSQISTLKREQKAKVSSLTKRIRAATHEPSSVKSQVLSGYTFYLCGDIETPHYRTQEEFGKIICENGGRISTFPSPDSLAISDKMVPKAVGLIQKKVPVYHPCWIFNSIEAGKVPEPEPSHFFSGNSQHTNRVDKFGFPLYRTPNQSEIMRIMTKIPIIESNDEEMNEALRYWGYNSTARAFVFLNKIFYLDTRSINTNEIKLLSNLIRYGNGKITVDSNCATHVVCNSAGLENTAANIVPSSWVKSSWFDNINLKLEF